MECNLEPNPLIKGRARAAHKAARIWQKLEFSTKSMNEYKALIDESTFNSLKAAKAPETAAPAPSGEIVRLHETVDFTRVRDVQMMSSKAHLDGLDIFCKLMHRQPFPAEKPSIAQMTALLETLKCGSCYVDFALWGSFHIRTARSFRFRGMAIGPGGTLIEVELKGPPSFEFWSPSWKVFQCGMIAADAAIPPVFNRIPRLDQRLQFSVWRKVLAIAVPARCQIPPRNPARNPPQGNEDPRSFDIQWIVEGRSRTRCRSALEPLLRPHWYSGRQDVVARELQRSSGTHRHGHQNDISVPGRGCSYLQQRQFPPPVIKH